MTSTQAELTRTLHDYDVHEPAGTAGQLRALRPWAQRLRAIFEAGPVTAKAERADELLAASGCRPGLVSHLHYGAVFIDTSRNGRRHFCSVRCANQVNVANHRSRQRLAQAR